MHADTIPSHPPSLNKAMSSLRKNKLKREEKKHDILSCERRWLCKINPPRPCYPHPPHHPHHH